MNSRSLKSLPALALIFAVLVIVPGCSLVEKVVRSTGTPISTNYVPRVELHTITNFVTVTNVIPGSLDQSTGLRTSEVVNIVRQTHVTYQPVTNLVAVTNYGPRPSIQTGIVIAQGAAEASGVPWAGAAVGTLATAFGALFGLYNRKKAQEATGKVNFMETASGVLVDNVEAMKKLALVYAAQVGVTDPNFPAKVNDYANQILSGAQTAAGVEDFVRKLVNDQTGHTKIETGIVATPQPAPA